MSKFIEVTILKTGSKIILNTDIIRVIERQGDNCAIFCHDTDKARIVKEDYDIIKNLLINV